MNGFVIHGLAKFWSTLDTVGLVALKPLCLLVPLSKKAGRVGSVENQIGGFKQRFLFSRAAR